MSIELISVCFLQVIKPPRNHGVLDALWPVYLAYAAVVHIVPVRVPSVTCAEAGACLPLPSRGDVGIIVSTSIRNVTLSFLPSLPPVFLHSCKLKVCVFCVDNFY